MCVLTIDGDGARIQKGNYETKRRGAEREGEAKGRFEWMRPSLLRWWEVLRL